MKKATTISIDSNKQGYRGREWNCSEGEGLVHGCMDYCSPCKEEFQTQLLIHFSRFLRKKERKWARDMWLIFGESGRLVPPTKLPTMVIMTLCCYLGCVAEKRIGGKV